MTAAKTPEELKARLREGGTDDPIPAPARVLLTFIGDLEAPKGYDQVYGRSRVQPPKPITTVPVDYVLGWQRKNIVAGSASTAAGRYQIIHKTLMGLVEQEYVHPDELFSPEVQDRLAFKLMRGRGYDRWAAGRLTDIEFADRLAAEWASLPMHTGEKRGRSRYDGDGLNSALTTPDAVLAVLHDAKRAALPAKDRTTEHDAGHAADAFAYALAGRSRPVHDFEPDGWEIRALQEVKTSLQESQGHLAMALNHFREADQITQKALRLLERVITNHGG